MLQIPLFLLVVMTSSTGFIVTVLLCILSIATLTTTLVGGDTIKHSKITLGTGVITMFSSLFILSQIPHVDEFNLFKIKPLLQVVGLIVTLVLSFSSALVWFTKQAELAEAATDETNERLIPNTPLQVVEKRIKPLVKNSIKAEDIQLEGQLLVGKSVHQEAA